MPEEILEKEGKPEGGWSGPTKEEWAAQTADLARLREAQDADLAEREAYAKMLKDLPDEEELPPAPDFTKITSEGIAKASQDSRWVQNRFEELVGMGYDKEIASLQAHRELNRRDTEEMLKPVLEGNAQRDAVGKSYSGIMSSDKLQDLDPPTVLAAARWAQKEGLGNRSPEVQYLAYLSEVHPELLDVGEPPPSPGIEDLYTGNRGAGEPPLPPGMRDSEAMDFLKWSGETLEKKGETAQKLVPYWRD